jgi:hypothetical protein
MNDKRNIWSGLAVTYTAIVDRFHIDRGYLTYGKEAFQTLCPDLILLGFILILTPFKTLDDPDPKGWTARWECHHFVMPILFHWLLFSLVFQPVHLRFCLARYFLESPVFRLFGYCSFPIYLLHMVLTNFYLRMMVEGCSRTSEYHRTYWFSSMPGWWKPIGLALVLSISWLVQRYYSDFLVASISSRLFSYATKYPSC